MLLTATHFSDVVLAIHILAVVVSFGVLFVYPLQGLIGVRDEPRAMPWFHRFQAAVHSRISAPGLVVVALAGIYLATDLHQWKDFYVGWGIAAVILIGAVGGAYIAPRERQLAELAETELAAAGASEPVWGPAYVKARREADRARLGQAVLAAVTVLFMALHLGAS